MKKKMSCDTNVCRQLMRKRYSENIYKTAKEWFFIVKINASFYYKSAMILTLNWRSHRIEGQRVQNQLEIELYLKNSNHTRTG